MRKDELGILIDYIDSRVKSSQKFSVKKGVIQNINTNKNIASVIIHKDSAIQAQYDINANYQEGDVVGILCVQGDSSKPSHNLIIGQFSGRPNPVATVNVLNNGDMEAGLDYWSFDSGVGLAEIDTDNSYMGAKCIAITPSVVQDEVSMYQLTDPTDCKPNEIYNTEAYFMTEGDASVKVRTQWFNASGGEAAESVNETEALYISSGSGWFPVRMSEISPSTASQCRVDAIIEVPELGNTVYVDNVGLYGYYTPSGGSTLDIVAGDGIVFTSGSTVINVDPADLGGLYFTSGDLAVNVDDSTVTINAQNELQCIASGGNLIWTEVQTTPYSMYPNNGYITSGGSQIILELPLLHAVGDTLSIVGKGTGGWRVTQNVGQIIHFGNKNTSVGAGGYIESTLQYDTVSLVSIVANVEWVVNSSIGNLTVA